MRRGAAVAAAVALALGASACRAADDPPDYSDLTRLAGRLNTAVGTPPGVAEVHALGGSIGDAGYFVIDVLLEPGATADQVLELVRVKLLHSTAVVHGGSGAPLMLRTPDADQLEPDWGPYADLAGEEPAVRAWVAAETELDARVTGQVGSDGGAFPVDLGPGAPEEVARAYRVLRPFSGHASWDLVASAGGTALRLASKDGAPDDAELSLWRSLVGRCRAPVGGFACSGLALAVDGPQQHAGSLVLRVPRSTEAAQLTPAAYGSTLLPLLTAQARLLKRSPSWQYDVEWSHEAGLVPVLDFWPRTGPSDAVQPSPLFQLPVQPGEEADPWASAVRTALRT